MNKLTLAAVIAGGLMLANTTGAKAHQEVRYVHHSHAYTQIDVRRPKHMPRWLKRDKAFRHWYAHTPLRRDRRLAWNELFEIFRWELRWGTRYYSRGDFRRDYYAPRYRERHYDRDYRRHEQRRRRGH